jgi:hypothetical protein
MEVPGVIITATTIITVTRVIAATVPIMPITIKIPEGGTPEAVTQVTVITETAVTLVITEMPIIMVITATANNLPVSTTGTGAEAEATSTTAIRSRGASIVR